jgi:endonuclease III
MATPRLKQIVSALRKFYGVLPRPPSDPFTLFVWEILFNHSTAARRDAAVAALKRLGALTPDGMWLASPKSLEHSVSRAGPYAPQRVMGLKKGVQVFRKNPGLAETIKGPAAKAIRELKNLPRMSGDSGPYRMLLFAGGQPVLPVDARVARVATRLGYGERTDNFPRTAKSIRQAMAAELPVSAHAYEEAYIYFEHHGVSTCTESHPQCDVCPLRPDCSYAPEASGTPRTFN